MEQLNKIRFLRRRGHRSTQQLSPLEKAMVANDLSDYCNASFGKGKPGCETLTYDLADYNREIRESKGVAANV